MNILKSVNFNAETSINFGRAGCVKTQSVKACKPLEKHVFTRYAFKVNSIQSKWMAHSLPL